MKPTFAIGEVVQVLAAAWLPKERTLGHGAIERITESSSGEPLYWINGFSCARTANVLRSSGNAYDVPEPAPRVRVIRCADCGCELIRHPDEPVTELKRCATCWSKNAR